MIDSGTVSSSNTGARQNHGELLSKIAEQRVALHNIQSKVEYIESQMEVDGAPAQAKLNAISLKSDATHASMISLRSLAEQFVALCREISARSARVSPKHSPGRLAYLSSCSANTRSPRPLAFFST